MMLHKFEVENLRAFGSRQILEFALPVQSNLGSGLTLLVGPNNSGKSTILRSIRNLMSRDDTFIASENERREEKAVGLKIAGVKNEVAFEFEVEKRPNTAHLKKINGWNYEIGNDLSFVPSRRPWQDRFQRQPGKSSVKEHDENLYINGKQNEFHVDSQFAVAIAQIEGDPERKEAFTDLLLKFEPTITSWTIDNRDGQDFISFESIAGERHRIGLVGDGVNNLFRLTFALFEFKSGSVLLLDEPELSLHPQAQKRLYAELRARSSLGQLIIATHSPHFIAWSDINAGAKVYRTNLRKGDGAELRALRSDTIQKISRVAQEKKNRKLYDVVAKEVFFSNGSLFVEGAEDAQIIGNFAEDFQRAPLEIFGYGSGGAHNIPNWLLLAQDLNIKAAAIFDGDSEGSSAFEKANELFKNNSRFMLKKLRTDDIRDKEEPKKKMGVFDRDWQLKEAHKVYFHDLYTEISRFLG